VRYKKSTYTLRALKVLSNTTWCSPLLTTVQSLYQIFQYCLQIQRTTGIHCMKQECQMQLFFIAQGVLTVRQNVRSELLLCMKCMAWILETGSSAERLKKIKLGNVKWTDNGYVMFFSQSAHFIYLRDVRTKLIPAFVLHRLPGCWLVVGNICVWVKGKFTL